MCDLSRKPLIRSGVKGHWKVWQIQEGVGPMLFLDWLRWWVKRLENRDSNAQFPYAWRFEISEFVPGKARNKGGVK